MDYTKKSGVYTITSTSGKQYVGQTADFINRWKIHRRQLRSGTHHNIMLQRAYDKYGDDGLRFSHLIYCDPKDCLMYEQLAIDSLKPQYNI